MIDYAWASLAAAVPPMMADAAATGRLIRNAGAAAHANCMVTNYEAGAVRLIPMKAHLAVDVAVCAALVLSPFFLPASERRYAAIPLLLGAAGLLAALMTQTESPAEQIESFTPSRELSEAVADPDVARSPHLRLHLE
ncbi:MAG: hypothetical protein HY657_07380 [Acidobacteria bacterium]|nr:hypothetical protein [Acidobacteriota bacterium]